MPRPLSFIYDCGHPQPPAAYPPTSGEQPSSIGIHGLATRQTYGRRTLLPPRWALTPPFHPYRSSDRRLFSVTLLHPHGRQAVNLDGALRCSDFPPFATVVFGCGFGLRSGLRIGCVPHRLSAAPIDRRTAIERICNRKVNTFWLPWAYACSAIAKKSYFCAMFYQFMF